MSPSLLVGTSCISLDFLAFRSCCCAHKFPYSLRLYKPFYMWYLGCGNFFLLWSKCSLRFCWSLHYELQYLPCHSLCCCYLQYPSLNHVWHGGGCRSFGIVCVRCIGYIRMEPLEEDVITRHVFSLSNLFGWWMDCVIVWFVGHSTLQRARSKDRGVQCPSGIIF